LTAGTYGSAGSVYQTEIADFSQITANGTAGNGPAYFTVQGREGRTYYYGYTDSNGNGANSQILASGTSTASTWLLSKVEDRAGNYYVINYTTLSGALVGTALPGTIYWSPTSAGSSTYTYTMQFNYRTNVAQSSVTKYIGGTPVSNTGLLTSVEVLVGTTVVKDYFLTYTPSSSTGREQLTSFQECPNSTQSSSNCLAPTTITYANPTIGTSSTVNTAVSSTGPFLTARYDLNGDGIPDLVWENDAGTAIYVAFGSARGYETPVNTGIPVVVAGTVVPVIGRLTGKQSDGILYPNGSTWWYYSWNGTAFQGRSTGLGYDPTAAYQLADVDGDGLPDLVYIHVVYNKVQEQSAVTIDVRLNTSSNGTPSFSSTAATWYTGVAWSTAQLYTPDRQYGKLRRFDFNGDGRDDVVLVTQIYGQWDTIELISTGTSFKPVLVALDAGQYVFFTNWNDDACTDYVVTGTLYISGCNGSIPTTFTIPGTIVAAMDWNGDGRTDLMVADGSVLAVYPSLGSGVGSLITTSIPYSSNCVYVTLDSTGSGLDDLGCWNQTGTGVISYYKHEAIPDLMTEVKDGYGNSASPTYVSIAQSNYTQSTDATYPYYNYIGPLYVVSNAIFSDPSNAGGTYEQTFSYFGAWTNLQGRGFQSFYAKRMIDSRNGLYYFKYYERAFPETGMVFEDDLSNNSANQITEVTRTPAVATLSSTTNEERYFPYFSEVTTKQYEVGGTENTDLITTLSTNYAYDNYGNATTIAMTLTDNDPGSPYTGKTWTATTTNTTDISVNESADLAQWCLTMMDETQVAYSSSLSGSSPVTRTQTFTPDTPTACRTKGTVTEPGANGGLYKVTEALTFDSFGNVATDTVTGANMPSSPASRETQMNWGTTGQFLNTLTDPSGAVTTWSYKSDQALTFGVPDSKEDANSLTTSWTYDAFGRKTKEARPDSTSTGWAWSACTSYCGWGNSIYQIAQTAYQTNGTTAIRTDTNSYDPIDRVTQTAGPTAAGKTATVQKLYNSLGLLTQQSLPFLGGATAYQQTFAYDVLNRPTSMTRPISSTNSHPQSTTYGYTGRTSTVTDPYGDVKTTISDVNGWPREAKDALGYTVTRAYDSAGSLTGITDSAGNTLLKNVTVVYGVKPFITAATDADLGAWTYTVDSLGERTGWADAKGQSFSMTYDALSRPLTRKEPDLFTEWNYGSAAPNWGRLTSECTQIASTANLCTTTGSSWLYKEIRAYDSLARPSTRSITQSGNTGGNDGGGAFLYTLAYSATTGLLNTLTYPKSTSSFALTLEYGYGYGLLQSVTDTADTTATCGTTCVLWTANAENGFGEVSQETLGNGVVTNRSYDAVTSWLTAATAGVGGGSGILNQSYLEDENGNVTQRQNNNLGLTESFFYDKDYRLTCATLSGSCSTPTFVYDGGNAGPGNITTQVGVGTYAYPAVGQPHPHAVTSITGTFNGITNPTFSYDANGNMTDRAGSSANISWSSYNYPTSISANDVTGSEEVQFNYGPDRQRWEQIYAGPSGTEETYYVGKNLEVVFNGTTNYRHYIYAGAEPVAIYSRTSAGVNTMSYMLEDHQAGVSAIASNSGTVDVDESFSAFGNRRNPTTWSGAPTTGDLTAIASVSRQGYTFQTWLGQSMGLNHMNGRVEDAILGRMFSPDPHIPEPTNAQSYNRYAYASNNPLTLVDPSGFEETTDPAPINGCNPESCSGDYVSGVSPSPPTSVSIEGPVQTNFDLVGSVPGLGWTPISSGNGSTVSSGGMPAAAANAATPAGDTGDQAQSGDPLSPVVVTATTLLPAITVTSTYTGPFNFAGFGNAIAPYDPAVSVAQFLAGSAGLGAGFAFSPAYAGVGAAFGAIGAGKASNGDPTSILMGAGLGSLTGGGTAAAGDAIGATGLGGAALISAFGGIGAGGTMATMNLLTGQPVTNNVGYATAIGALGPLASGEAMVIGGAGYAGDSALGYILNFGTSGFTTALGP
jgi:RHS repeat-associated protein